MLKIQTNTPNLLFITTLIVFSGVFLFIDPISQKSSYHHFSEDKLVIGFDNFWNVWSNIGFVIVGLYGLSTLYKFKISDIISIVLFSGIVLTGLGSAYYHNSPCNATLVWDRIPMTIVFCSFFAKIYEIYFSKRIALFYWIIGTLLGIFSVFYWYFTEINNQGDLRLYAIIQFLPMLLIVLILARHSNENKFIRNPLLITICWYVLAKLAEHYDFEIFTMTHFISGHPIKHILAAISTFYIVKIVLNSFYLKKLLSLVRDKF